MRIADLITFINSLVPHKYYAYSFPTTSDAPGVAVSIGQGLPMDRETSVKRPSIQLLVRGDIRDIAGAEAKAYDIFNALADRQEVKIGADSVVQIYPTSSAPFFIGLDEAYRPVFSMNFIAVVRP